MVLSACLYNFYGSFQMFQNLKNKKTSTSSLWVPILAMASCPAVLTTFQAGRLGPPEGGTPLLLPHAASRDQ